METPLSSTNEKIPTGILREALEEGVALDGWSMNDLTVLGAQNDPFRVDTPAGHRDGEWLAMHLERLAPNRVVHLRGVHYILVSAGLTKPNGEPYVNTEKDWLWMTEKAAKAARWLGLIPFSAIRDQRNEKPTVRRWEPKDPAAYILVGVGIELPDPEDLVPTVDVEGFDGVQPYKLVLVGEKSSLAEVLAPIAQEYKADLYLPTGEISDTMLYEMASVADADGRPMVVLYFSDCDPSGWQMPISVGRKLQALETAEFPGLEFQVHRVALTPDQVKAYGLPSAPLKSTERRADRWTVKMGVEQTEIDALAALQPDLLRRITRDALAPFFDRSLDRRVREAREEWLQRAQESLDAQLGEERLAAIRAEAEDRIAEMQEQVDALRDALRIDSTSFNLPAFEIPEHDVDMDGLPSPLIDSEWGFIEGSRRLKAAKAYEEDE